MDSKYTTPIKPTMRHDESAHSLKRHMTLLAAELGQGQSEAWA